MNTFKLNAIAIAVGFAFSGIAMAQAMSNDDYKSAKSTISADYQAAKAGCASMNGNAKDICMAEAGAKEKIARAELDAKYKPSADASYKVSAATAEANYAIAKEKCDDLAGNAKSACRKDAKAAEMSAKSDARMSMKPVGNSDNAYRTPGSRDAGLAMATDKCDALSGDEKKTCMSDARAHSGAAASANTRSKMSANAEMNGMQTNSDMRAANKPGKSDAEMAVAKQKCDALPGDAKNNCMTDLMLRFGRSAPTVPDNANQRSGEGRQSDKPGKSDAELAAAKQKCDALPGDAKSNCMTDLTLRFGRTGPEASGSSSMNSMPRNSDGRMGAGMGKSDAEFVAAKQKCDALQGETKNSCMTDVMLRFGKS